MSDPLAPTHERVDSEKLEEGPVVKDSAFADGTYHQSRVGDKPVRRHFFSPPDGTLAEAVNQDADCVEFTEEEEVGSRFYCVRPHLAHALRRKPYGAR